MSLSEVRAVGAAIAECGTLLPASGRPHVAPRRLARTCYPKCERARICFRRRARKPMRFGMWSGC